MSTTLHHLFDGYELDVEIQTTRLTAHQRDIVRKEVARLTPQSLRYNCLVAEALNAAVGGADSLDDYSEMVVGTRTFRLNPNAKAQFGINHDGEPYLTVGLVDLTEPGSTRYRLTWKNENVPYIFMELAVAHDNGENIDGVQVPLSLSAAEVHILGQKDGKVRHDPRRNHDTGPDGKPYPRPPRPHHRRVCEADLKKHAKAKGRSK